MVRNKYVRLYDVCLGLGRVVEDCMSIVTYTDFNEFIVPPDWSRRRIESEWGRRRGIELKEQEEKENNK